MSTRPVPMSPARREILDYIKAQTPPLQTAVEVHKQWAAQLATIYEAVKAGRHANAALRARSLGKQFGTHFRHILKQAEGLRPPAPALRCHEYFLRWLKCLINACDALSNAPEDGKDTSYLRDAHDYVDDARYAVKPLNEIRQRLYEAAQGVKATPGTKDAGGAKPAQG